MTATGSEGLMAPYDMGAYTRKQEYNSSCSILYKI
ncbi:MAG: hypothetical protein JWP78_747 [Mucilaginibacter sp.]|nr:hypothetical protein [Mucilaginibacter sp.]